MINCDWLETYTKNIKNELAEEIFDAIEKIMEDNRHYDCQIGDCIENYYDDELFNDFWELRGAYVKKKNMYPNEECGSCPIWLNIDENMGIGRGEAIEKYCSKCDLYNKSQNDCKR